MPAPGSLPHMIKGKHRRDDIDINRWPAGHLGRGTAARICHRGPAPVVERLLDGEAWQARGHDERALADRDPHLFGAETTLS